MPKKPEKSNLQELEALFRESNRIYGPGLSKKDRDQLIAKQEKLLAEAAKSEKRLNEILANPPKQALQGKRPRKGANKFNKDTVLKELGFQAILNSPLKDKKLQALTKRFCKNLFMKEDGLLLDSEVSGAESTLHIYGPIFGATARIAYGSKPESLEDINRMLLVSALFNPNYHLFERVRRGRFNWFNFEPSWDMEDAVAEMKKINSFHKSTDFKSLSSCRSLRTRHILGYFGGDPQSTMVSYWTDAIIVQEFSESWGVIMRILKCGDTYDFGFFNDKEVIRELELYVDDDASLKEKKKYFFSEEGEADISGDPTDYDSLSILGFINLESYEENEFIEKINPEFFCE